MMTQATRKALPARRRPARRAAGLTLIEVLLAITIAGGALALGFNVLQERTRDLRDRNTGEQMSLVRDATERFVFSNYNDILNGLQAGGGTGTVTIDQLVNGGFLPATLTIGNAGNRSVNTPFGAPVEIATRLDATVTPPRVEALVYIDSSTDIPTNRAALIASIIGAEGGFVRNRDGAPDIINGAGGWATDRTDFGLGGTNEEGLVTAFVSFTDNDIVADFLYRTDIGLPEANTMRAPLRMGDNAAAEDIIMQGGAEDDLAADAARNADFGAADAANGDIRDARNVTALGTISAGGQPGAVIVDGLNRLQRFEDAAGNFGAAVQVDLDRDNAGVAETTVNPGASLHVENSIITGTPGVGVNSAPITRTELWHSRDNAGTPGLITGAVDFNNDGITDDIDLDGDTGDEGLGGNLLVEGAGHFGGRLSAGTPDVTGDTPESVVQIWGDANDSPALFVRGQSVFGMRDTAIYDPGVTPINQIGFVTEAPIMEVWGNALFGGAVTIGEPTIVGEQAASLEVWPDSDGGTGGAYIAGDLEVGGSTTFNIIDAVRVNTTDLDVTSGIRLGGAGGAFPTNGEIFARNALFEGDVRATSFTYTSDARLKQNIDQLSGALERLLEIRGVAYDWRETGQHDIGLIAQEVARVWPELVTRDPSTGQLGVKYGNLVGPMIEAIRELKQENDRLAAQISGARVSPASLPVQAAARPGAVQEDAPPVTVIMRR